MEKGQHVVKIHFDDKERAEAFVLWMCEAGEQDYFQAAEYGNFKSVNSFEYHMPQDERYPSNDKRRYKDSKFGGEDGLTIIAKDDKDE